jgi:hypothetical protein
VFISRQYDASKGHSAICTGASCPPTDAMKTFDLTKLGLPSNAELLQSIRFNLGHCNATRATAHAHGRGGHMRFSLAPAGSSCHSHCIATVPPPAPLIQTPFTTGIALTLFAAHPRGVLRVRAPLARGHQLLRRAAGRCARQQVRARRSGERLACVQSQRQHGDCSLHALRTFAHSPLSGSCECEPVHAVVLLRLLPPRHPGTRPSLSFNDHTPYFIMPGVALLELLTAPAASVRLWQQR